MKPIIGIIPSRTTDYNSYELRKNYSDVIFDAGGIPYIIPYPLDDISKITSHYIKKVDGLLYSGGVDPDPINWNEQPLPGIGRIDPVRDQFELELVKQANKAKLPQLGICRGCQLINVALGGSIIQDLQTNSNNYIKHIQDAPHWYPTHSIEIKKGTFLSKLIAPPYVQRVNSFHHQAIKELAPDLHVSAVSSDGVIEAFEDKVGLIIGVQWHPERMKKESYMMQLFYKLIELC